MASGFYFVRAERISFTIDHKRPKLEEGSKEIYFITTVIRIYKDAFLEREKAKGY